MPTPFLAATCAAAPDAHRSRDLVNLAPNPAQLSGTSPPTDVHSRGGAK